MQLKLYYEMGLRLYRLMKSHRPLRWHVAAITVETTGTFFIFMETLRLNAIATDQGISLGTPKGYEGLIYHLGLLGFSFLFGGLIVQLAIIFYDDVHHATIDGRLKTVERSVQEIKSQKTKPAHEGSSFKSP